MKTITQRQLKSDVTLLTLGRFNKDLKHVADPSKLFHVTADLN